MAGISATFQLVMLVWTENSSPSARSASVARTAPARPRATAGTSCLAGSVESRLTPPLNPARRACWLTQQHPVGAEHDREPFVSTARRQIEEVFSQERLTTG